MGGSARLFGAAVVTGIAVVAWVLGHMVPFFYVLKLIGMLRVDEEDEVRACTQVLQVKHPKLGDMRYALRHYLSHLAFAQFNA